MEKRKLGRNIIFFIFVLIVIYFAYIAYGFYKSKNEIVLSIENSDINFSFKNNILVHDYEVRSLLERKEGSLEYKEMLKGVIEKEVSNIKIKEYKENNIQNNKPYYLSISREGLKNEPGVVMQTINFCIKDDNSIYTEENEDKFIKNCTN